GLQLAVQRFLPEFFKLKIGLTTGTCATAAAVAASHLLAGNDCGDYVRVILPSGEPVGVPVARCERIDDTHARASVVKDGGDDPDVTTGLEIVADVAVVDASTGVTVNGGEGVGRATLPGLGIKVGDAAINSVPRTMIQTQVQSVLPDKAVEVMISVPRGREIAARTFNPRLGVSGGISIIGTTGVVRPFSNDAFVESLRRQISVAIASGCDTIVLNSGARSERVMKEVYTELPQVAFIHYGNLIGEAVHVAAEAGIQNIVVGIMIGKLVKLAAGSLDTHSGNVIMAHEFLLEIGREVGLTAQSLAAIPEIKLARELWQLLSDDPSAQAFYDALLSRAYTQLVSLASPSTLTMRLINGVVDGGGNGGLNQT
ncbi:MAG: cobalt-precorrin-5B (C(1))-methyltransferase CbiD, partial [Muribaculum sp.]|nr:cobalt-precorrin-5B (C(1))-methyltransferase CbiD [Muribaculum sp.]